MEGNTERCAEQVGRLLSSNTLKNAESLRRLLAYLSEQTLAGRADSLKEYTVGVEAFGKPSDYDPKSDSSVRVLLSNLRKKLDEYYRSEGQYDPLVLELPKGHFQLTLRQNTERRLAGRWRTVLAAWRWQWVSLALALALVGTAALAVHWRKPTPVNERSKRWMALHWNPALEAFWKPYLKGRRLTLVSLGTPLFVSVPRGFWRDPRINNWQRAEESGLVREIEQIWKSAPAEAGHVYTGIGEALGAYELATIFAAHGRDLLVQPSNDVTWEDISDHNLIFLGAEKLNPHLSDLPERQDLVIRESRLRNQKPRPGEALFFDEGKAVRQPDGTMLREGYALVTRLRGLHGRGYIMILASTATEGSRAAAEYVTHPEYAAQLVEKLQTGAGVLPEQFQVVLKVRYKSMVPVSIAYVTHHVLPENSPSGTESAR